MQSQQTGSTIIINMYISQVVGVAGVGVSVDVCVDVSCKCFSLVSLPDQDGMAWHGAA